MFRIPYYYPPFNPGIQITDFQVGGPSSHLAEVILAPRITPTVYSIALYGLGNMPRQVFGQVNPIDVNAYSNPIVQNNLQIAGLMKKPTYS